MSSLCVTPHFSCHSFISGKCREHLWHWCTWKWSSKPLSTDEVHSLCFYCKLARIQDPFVFGSLAFLWSTHRFSDLGFFFPITPTSKETGSMIRKNSTSNFLPWPEENFSVQSLSGAYLLPLSLSQAEAVQPWQHQEGDANTRLHGQNEGWEDGDFQPFRTALSAPSCTAQFSSADSQAEPSHHWQIEGNGFIGISDLIRYNKPLCSLANLVKRLLFKKIVINVGIKKQTPVNCT